MTLDAVLNKARAIEAAATQATKMEKETDRQTDSPGDVAQQTNSRPVKTTKSRYPTRDSQPVKATHRQKKLLILRRSISPTISFMPSSLSSV